MQAGLVGTLWKRHRGGGGGGKSLAGSAACALACGAVAVVYAESGLCAPCSAPGDSSLERSSMSRLAGVALLCGALGAAAERLDVGLDDNLSMPLAAGAALTVVRGWAPLLAPCLCEAAPAAASRK